MQNYSATIYTIILDITSCHESAEFVRIVWDFTQLLDDLVDGDEVKGDMANRVMFDTLITLNENDFFISNRAELIPIMKSCMFQWWSANDYESRPTKENIDKSYMLRASFYHLMNHVVYLNKGPEFVLGNNMYDFYSEKLDDLYKEMEVKDG